MDALLERLSCSQIRGWMTYFVLEAEDAEERRAEASSQARLAGRMR